MFSRGGELLTQTEDIVRRWKEHFEELLNPTNTSSGEEAESEASGEAPPISLAEVAEVVKQLFSGKAPGVDEIRPEMLKALDIVGLSWLTRLCNVAWGSGTVPVAWQTGGGPHFQKGGPEGVLQLSGDHTAQPPRESLFQGAGKEAPGRLLNLKFRRSNVASVLAVEQWTSSLPLQGCCGGHGSLLIQSTCDLMTTADLFLVNKYSYIITLWLLPGYCMETSLCRVKNSNAFTILPIDIVIINHNVNLISTW